MMNLCGDLVVVCGFFLFHETKPQDRFLTAHYDSILSFFPARQVSEKIFNESSKSSENALIN
jgi:hypothetical protein